MARWWQDGFTDGADAEYTEQILPMAAAHLAGAAGCSTWLRGGSGRPAGAAARASRSSSGWIRRGPRWRSARDRAGGPAYGLAGAAALPFPDGAVRRRRRLPRVRAHPRGRRGHRRGRRGCSRPAAGSCFFLNHPLLQAPGSGWIDDQVLDPPEQYWRIGPYLVEDESLEQVERGVFIPFIHRPLSRYVNALVHAGLLVSRMEEPAPPPGFLARAEEYADAATIPRLLFLTGSRSTVKFDRVDRRPENGGDGVPRDHRAVGGGPIQAADILEDLGWFVIDNLPPR